MLIQIIICCFGDNGQAGDGRQEQGDSQRQQYSGDCAGEYQQDAEPTLGTAQGQHQHAQEQDVSPQGVSGQPEEIGILALGAEQQISSKQHVGDQNNAGESLVAARTTDVRQPAKVSEPQQHGNDHAINVQVVNNAACQRRRQGV